jgi:hypothetical protein
MDATGIADLAYGRMRTVTAPDGREWKVGRQWLPRRVRIRPDRSIGDLSDLMLWDDLGGFAIGILIAVGLLLVVFVIFPIVAIALELLLLILLLLVGVIGRVALRKPWHVLARTGEAAYRWPVKGWRASGERIDEVAAALASGSMPPGAELVTR